MDDLNDDDRSREKSLEGEIGHQVCQVDCKVWQASVDVYLLCWQSAFLEVRRWGGRTSPPGIVESRELRLWNRVFRAVFSSLTARLLAVPFGVVIGVAVVSVWRSWRSTSTASRAWPLHASTWPGRSIMEILPWIVSQLLVNQSAITVIHGPVVAESQEVSKRDYV